MFQTGSDLPPIAKGPYTSSRIARWCAAQQNWDRIHYDQDYALKRARLPGTVINGALKQHLLAFFLAERIGLSAWIRMLDYRFVGTDLVGDALTLEGVVSEVRDIGDRVGVSVALTIKNVRSGEITTTGNAELLLNRDGAPVLDALELVNDEPAMAVMPAGASDEGIPEHVRSRLRTILEEVTSYCPVERGRLVLFADAVMDVPAIFFDEAAAAAGPYGAVVAPPLYPIHAMVGRPGERRLDENAEAMGREGVCEIGRNFATMFGFRPTGLLNGGNRVRVHSLVRVGETVRGTSRLLSVRRRRGQRGGDMLIFETINTYETTGGRPLLTEQQSIVYRME